MWREPYQGLAPDPIDRQGAFICPSLALSDGSKSPSDYTGAGCGKSLDGNLVSLPESFQFVLSEVSPAEMTAVSSPGFIHFGKSCKDSGILAQDFDAGRRKPMTTQIPCVNPALLTEHRFFPCAIPEILRQGDQLCALFKQELTRPSPVGPVHTPLLSGKRNQSTRQPRYNRYPSRHVANMPLSWLAIKRPNSEPASRATPMPARQAGPAGAQNPRSDATAAAPLCQAG